jgi:hypothetical protein
MGWGKQAGGNYEALIMVKRPNADLKRGDE